MRWKKNQLVWIEVDQSSGPARIVDDLSPNFFKIQFLEDKQFRNYTKKNPPFRRVYLSLGQKVKLKSFDQEQIIEKIELKDHLFFFETKQGKFSETDVEQLVTEQGALELLQQKKISPAQTFYLRRNALSLLSQRESYFLKGAVGCRVQFLPHQLWILDSVLKMNPIRALLADEVGLGKTIEAGLIFSALHAQRQLKKVLILTPSALKVQWLTECYRRFNIRFRLDHEELIEEDEFRDFVISSLEEIESNQNAFDFLIIDEAHRLVHDPLRAQILEKIVKDSRHVLFLSATPDVHGPLEFQKMMAILGSANEKNRVPLVFRSKRSELGLPCFRRLEATFVKDKFEWLLNFLSEKLENRKKEKVFLIGHSAEAMVSLWSQLRQRLGENFALFHEQMDLVERDRQAAYFANPEGAQFLISSEVGGEGRNFQFCHHLVLLDLPSDPLVIEQRIGRLDRLGQTEIVKVWCPVVENAEEEKVFEELRDTYRVFEEPWAGSGLEDLSEKNLLETRTVDIELSSLNRNFIKMIYEPEKAEQLLKSVQKFSEIEIRDFLEGVYDVFGIEVEDFDTRGGLKVSASSLMFVDFFPGLGESGERVLTFDRGQALAREDMTLFTLDHPDFIESLEFFLNSEQGRVALAPLPAGERKDVLILGLERSLGSYEVNTWLWSYQKKNFLSAETYLKEKDSIKSVQVTAELIDLLVAAVREAVESRGVLAEKEESQVLEALLIFLPQA